VDEQLFLARVRRAVRRTAPHFGLLMNDHIRRMRAHGAAGKQVDRPASGMDRSGEAAGDLTAPGAVPRYLGELLDLPAPSDQDGLIDRWTREFERLGGRAVIAAGTAEAVGAVVTIVREVVSRRGGPCAVPVHPLLADWNLAQALEQAGVPVVHYRGLVDREALAGAEVGVVVASAAIAETGTLVYESHAYQGRCASLLPPIAVTVVPPGAVVPGVAGWFAERGARFRGGEEMPSSIAFATGPSRSADIAGDLALGVHGPGEVHAVLVRG
jgi:L-lactate dehydrogenase complex protein LldG